MSSQAERLRDLILNALATSIAPLAPRDIHNYCGGSTDKQKTYAQIHYLKTNGQIVLDPDEHGAPRYRLPQLAVKQEIAMPAPRLETELSASAELDAESPFGTRLVPADAPHYEPDPEGDDLDIGPPPAVERHDGDEFERSSAGCCGRCAGGHDPVVSEPKPATGTELARLVWKQPHGDRTRTLTLDLSCTPPRLHTNGAFDIDADLLAEIHDRIENRYREAA